MKDVIMFDDAFCVCMCASVRSLILVSIIFLVLIDADNGNTKIPSISSVWNAASRYLAGSPSSSRSIASLAALVATPATRALRCQMSAVNQTNPQVFFSS